MSIIDNLRTLWRTIVPHRVDPAVADLQHQLEETRRLCSETQARFKRAEEIARSFMADGPLETYRKMQADRDNMGRVIENLIIERNQLQDRLTAALLEVARMTAVLDARPFFKEPS